MDFNSLPFPLRIFFIVLVVTLIFFYVVYPLGESFILQNSQIFYFLLSIVYTYIMWRIIINETSVSSLPKDFVSSIKFGVILYLVLLNWELLMFPYLVTQDGVLTGLSAGAMISSDIFVYNLLPQDIPEIIKYGIVFCLVPALSFTLIALIAKKEKTFNKITQKTLR